MLAVGDQPAAGRPLPRGHSWPPQRRGWSCPSSCPHRARSLARTLADKTRARYQQGVASGLANALGQGTQVARILASEVIRAESGT